MLNTDVGVFLRDVLTVGRRPSRKRSGRPGPPPRYPKDQKLYADPENWKYPVHTPFHARAARRYFNKPQNRSVYDPEEQLYMDSRIDQALKSFGIDPKSIRAASAQVTSRRVVEEKPPRNVRTASRDACLKFLLGESRLRRAKTMKDDELRILRHGRRRLDAKIRGYIVKIDFKERTIIHNCTDWNRRKSGKKLCKHIGKIMLVIPEKKATVLLRHLIANPDSWHLS